MYQDNGFSAFVRDTPLFFKFFFGLILLFVVGVIVYTVTRGLSIWMSNNRAERKTVWCKVVDKRTEVWGGAGDASANTNYYITFEFEDRTRKEFYVKPNQYGLIVVGDQGELTYQGTRFVGFARI